MATFDTDVVAHRPTSDVAGFVPPISVGDLRARLGRWVWPSMLMAMAVALSWALSGLVFDRPVGYAPITAIVAMGLGRERRLWRSAIVVAGLIVGIAIAEAGGRFLGVGWWQIGAILGVSALVGGLVFDTQLAVTYAAINAVVLHGAPGSEGWVPNRAIDGVIGVAAALVVTYVLFPPDPVAEIRMRIRQAGAVIRHGLEATATTLRDPADNRDRRSDDAPLHWAQRVDGELDRIEDTVGHALDVAHWAPRRRTRRTATQDLATSAFALHDGLTTASTVMRLADRAVQTGVAPPPVVTDGLQHAARAVEVLIECIIDRVEPPDETTEALDDMLDRLLERDDQAVTIALREEIRGLLADIADLLGEVSDDDQDIAVPSQLHGRTSGGLGFGSPGARGGPQQAGH